MNHKRRRCRRHVRCVLCTPNRSGNSRSKDGTRRRLELKAAGRGAVPE